MDIGPGELIIALVVLLVLFGGKKIPELARGLGQAQREFKKGLSNDDEHADPDADAAIVPAVAVPIDDSPETSSR